MKTKLTSFLLAVTALSVAHLSAQVPQLINYQGRVAVDGVNFDGAGQFKFALVDGGTNTTPTHTTTTGSVQVVNGFVVGITVTDGGNGYVTPPAVTITGAGNGATATAVLTGDTVTSVTVNNPGTGYTGTPTVSFDAPPAPVEQTDYISYWSNDGTSADGSEPTASVSLQVKKGLYSVLLGDATLANMTTVPATIFSNPGVFLRVWFNDGVNGFQLMTPDQRIAAVGYAAMAGNVVPKPSRLMLPYDAFARNVLQNPKSQEELFLVPKDVENVQFFEYTYTLSETVGYSGTDGSQVTLELIRIDPKLKSSVVVYTFTDSIFSHPETRTETVKTGALTLDQSSYNYKWRIKVETFGSGGSRNSATFNWMSVSFIR